MSSQGEPREAGSLTVLGPTSVAANTGPSLSDQDSIQMNEARCAVRITHTMEAGEQGCRQQRLLPFPPAIIAHAKQLHRVIFSAF